jgi:hypothetical protein
MNSKRNRDDMDDDSQNENKSKDTNGDTNALNLQEEQFVHSDTEDEADQNTIAVKKTNRKKRAKLGDSDESDYDIFKESVSKNVSVAPIAPVAVISKSPLTTESLNRPLETVSDNNSINESINISVAPNSAAVISKSPSTTISTTTISYAKSSTSASCISIQKVVKTKEKSSNDSNKTIFKQKVKNSSSLSRRSSPRLNNIRNKT